jgi:hypothetical protein
MDILTALPNWSHRNLRWFIDYIARLNNVAGQPNYTVLQRRACELRDARNSTGQQVADNNQGCFILGGVGQHEFGRCKSDTECRELASRMGLGIVAHLADNAYFGHAMILGAPE